MLAESAVPELAVEAFDERILRRLARLDEGQRHVPLTRPEEHGLAGQLRPVIADNRGWQRALLRSLIQKLGQASAGNGRVHQLAVTLSAEIVHDVQHTKATPPRPAGPIRSPSTNAGWGGPAVESVPSAGSSACAAGSEPEGHTRVQPVGTLAIDPMTGTR